MHRSVERQTDDIGSPPRLAEEQVRRGYRHPKESCVRCRGAAGQDPTARSRGMRPQPTELAKAAGCWSSVRLSWLVKHGIGMSGMPAFGPRHDGEDIRGIVAFVGSLPELPPERCRALVQEGQRGGGESGPGGRQPAQGEDEGSR